ncbi:MAG TPA: ABC transporter permease [Thermoanaerobaculia bacterium]|nr:ABC transporter permease [Thermoanaerobaculia bacterium]
MAVVPLFSSPRQFRTGTEVVAHHELVAREAAAVPGVDTVGLGSAGPLFGGVETGEIELPGGEAATGDRAAMRARWFDVDAGYLGALGMRRVAGRSFEDGDRAGAPPVAIVNETMARRLWPGDEALGRRVRVQEWEAEVVGVVSDMPALTPGQPIEPQIFWPKRQVSRWGSFLVVRATPGIDPAGIERALRERLGGFDPQLDLGRWLPLERAFDRELVRPRFTLAVLGVFASLGVLLAAVGTYGVVGHVVASRARESGIRIALGAPRRSIALRAFRSGALPVAAGLALGIVVAVSLPRGLRAAIPGVADADWTTLAAMAALFVGVSALACWVPARRAARVDPIEALRAE